MNEHSLIPAGREGRHSAKQSLHAGFTWEKSQKVKSAKVNRAGQFPLSLIAFSFFSP